MSSSHGRKPKHLASSPFAPPAEVVVETYVTDDRVCHDLHGIGRVTGVDSHAITVDFGDKVVRIQPPYPKLQHL